MQHLKHTRIILVLAIMGLVALCGHRPAAEASAYLSELTWDTAQVRLVGQQGITKIRVELAVSRSQQARGLMERRSLPADAGMLFVYDQVQPPRSAFWMFRTHLPLDIAFMDANGTISAIRRMLPCRTAQPEGCPVYEAGVPFRYALEVNAGFFERHGIGLGGRLILQDLPGNDRP